MRKRFQLTDLFIGFVFTLLFISISVVITINFRPLYYMDINNLHIEETSGFSKQEILQNYNALIDYCSPFFQGELKFPTLDASQNGLQHFAEVKKIFIDFYLLGAITLIIGIAIVIRKVRMKDYSYLPVTAITAIIFPLVLSFFLFLNFDQAFLLFHKLLFKNNYWLFDPSTDPVILILPDQYFMHCAVLMVFIVLLFCAIFIGIYFWKKNHSGIRYRKNKNLKF